MSTNLPAFLTAQWRHLIMLNFEVDPAILSPHVPAGTELDVWNGRNYVSIVGFRFLDTRLLGFPIPFHRNFNEVNLRFYVRRKTDSEWRRGVVFIKEVVPLPAVTLVARWVYNENYVTLPMRHLLQPPLESNGLNGSFEYSWKSQGAWIRLSAVAGGEARPLTPGSEEEFITEHYWGYTRQRDGSTMEYGVEHPAWSTWETKSSQLTGDVRGLYGPEFGDVLIRPPTSTFVADGSTIVVRKGTRFRV